MDPRPQSPTSINHMIKYGTNLLQAVGNFDAHYVVLIAFMSAVPSTDLPAPDDYVRPTIGADALDAEIVEGSSMVSLNCPFSFARMKIPAKGRTCKHLQCFDLSNYIEINSKRPSWRCPHCNQAVCFPETRIDQNMTKILKTVPKEVSDVIIRSDGSWEIARGSDNHKHELHAKASEGPPEGLNQQQASHLSNVCDLTEEDVDMTPVDPPVHKDSTPKGASHLGHSGALSVPSGHKTGANPNPVGSISASISGHSTPSTNREQRAVIGNNQQSSSQTLVRTPSTNSLQQSQNARTITSPPGYATPNSASRTPTSTPGHPRTHSPSPRVSSSSMSASSSPRDSAQPRQVPQPTWLKPAPQTSASQKQFNAPLYMEPPPLVRLQFPRAGIRLTEEELQTIRENARRERERVRIQTLPPPTAPKQPPTPGSQGAAQGAPPDQSWRPLGRMRGSLAGKPTDALSEMIIRPSSQAAPPPPESSDQADYLSASLRTLLARRNSGSQPNAPQK